MAIILLEIGTEEIPAAYLPPALAQLTASAQTALRGERITFEAVQGWATPRRITLEVTDAAERQTPITREVRGPSVESAFAVDGEPTQAAIGFARSQGIPVSELAMKRFESGEYLVAVFHDEGRPTAEILPAVFTTLITSLTFPKTMRWGDSPLRFARPIRWLVALLDDRVIPCVVDGITAGRLTRGHRFLSPGEVAVPHAADYRRVMDENHVLVAPDERREAIRAQLDAIAQQDGAVLVDDGSLLEETTYHVEYPTAVRCNYDSRFLSLPEEVLVHVLRCEQQFFPLADAAGTLLPAFIGVRNGDKAYLGTVRGGYEAVARAKLLDALFFYEQDRAQPLGDRVETLRGVVFQERLGTMHDKAMRVQALVGAIADRLGFSAQHRALAERSALLCKADLVTAVVTEYPRLQGTMGCVYARESGEAEPVAMAISEHYRPQSAGDPIPATPIGQAVALADKLDTLAACFAIGLLPTSSEDPYALRREAQGIIRILTEAYLRLPLSRLIDEALARIIAAAMLPADETRAALVSYLRQRLETALATRFPASVVTAVMAVSADLPADALRRAEVIQRSLDDPAFQVAVRAATRLDHISKETVIGEMDEQLLTASAETALLKRCREIAPRAEFYATRGEFSELPALFTTLTPAVDRFFSETHVMADDPALRRTRLLLIRRTADIYRLLGALAMLPAS